MKRLLLLLAAGLMTGTTIAQDLPQPSPSAEVEQTVGLTEIKVTYSRPGVKGRTIFGDLVPYDKIWRLGANKATQFTTSTDIMFGDQTLKAGSYAMFATPSKTSWKVVFNTNTEQWGAGEYDASKDAVSVMAKTSETAMTESMLIHFTDVTNNSAKLVISWEKTRVEIPFSVNTEKAAMANIEAAIKKGEDLDKVYYRAASYYHKSLKDDKKALASIEKGLKVNDTHNLHFLRAQIWHEAGKNEEAIKEAEVAHKLALKAEAQGWADYIKKNIEDWKK